LGLATLALAAACARLSPTPKGWQPITGASGMWSSGNGRNAQEYFYSTHEFAGTLSDLASRAAIDGVIRYHGKLRGTRPFEACPGVAAVVSFQLRTRQLLEIGFAVRNGQAVRVSYLRPATAARDPNVTEAMRNALCTGRL
jgi:hypothetical protein